MIVWTLAHDNKRIKAMLSSEFWEKNVIKKNSFFITLIKIW